jgi:hypothetical protein
VCEGGGGGESGGGVRRKEAVGGTPSAAAARTAALVAQPTPQQLGWKNCFEWRMENRVASVAAQYRLQGHLPLIVRRCNVSFPHHYFLGRRSHSNR